MTAETSNARGEWPERYACNGPEGTFWTDDAALANKLIGAAFDRDEWTVTDTQNPTGVTPPSPAAARGDVRYDRELIAQMLDAAEAPAFTMEEMDTQARLLREAAQAKPEARGGGEVCTNCKMPKDGRGWLRPVEMCQCATIASPPSAPVGAAEDMVLDAIERRESSAPVGADNLVGLLGDIRDLLASLPVDCLGSGTDASGEPYPIRDEVISGITTALAQQPAAVVDGWRLVIRYGEYDNEPGVWAEKDGSFVWVAALAQQGGSENG